MRFSLLAAAVVLGAAPLAAQTAAPHPVELGVDAGVSFGFDPSVTTISVPTQRLRAGFFISNAISVEPAVAFNRVSFSGGSASSFIGDLGLLAHIAGTPRTPQVYLRPSIGLQRASGRDDAFGAGGSLTQLRVGAGLGVKVPIIHRLSWRFEAGYLRTFESGGVPGRNNLNLSAGLSFFTR